MTAESTNDRTDRDPVQLNLTSGASARVLPYGAHVISWRPAGNRREHLFMSEKALFEQGKAIRGGVPVVFPQFAGRGPLPKHGFARVRQWQLLSNKPVEGARSEEAVEAVFTLKSDDETRDTWSHDFSAVYRVTLTDDQLDMQLQVSNTGTEAWSFTSALHTYFAVGDIRATKLEGLKESLYQDDGVGEPQPERRAIMTFSGHMDRVYHETQEPLLLKSPQQTTRIEGRGFPDTVVWNPGPELSTTLADMADGGHESMLCVESAAVEPVQLQPGDTWTGSQILSSEE